MEDVLVLRERAQLEERVSDDCEHREHGEEYDEDADHGSSFGWSRPTVAALGVQRIGERPVRRPVESRRAPGSVLPQPGFPDDLTDALPRHTQYVADSLERHTGLSALHYRRAELGAGGFVLCCGPVGAGHGPLEVGLCAHP
jgi:hypothetical protein